MDELYKFWFDNFTPKKWSHARHVMNSGQKLVGNLGRNQIWPMWICKGRKITLLKVRDKKIILQNVRDVLKDFLVVENQIEEKPTNFKK